MRRVRSQPCVGSAVPMSTIRGLRKLSVRSEEFRRLWVRHDVRALPDVAHTVGCESFVGFRAVFLRTRFDTGFGSAVSRRVWYAFMNRLRFALFSRGTNVGRNSYPRASAMTVIRFSVDLFNPPLNSREIWGGLEFKRRASSAAETD